MNISKSDQRIAFSTWLRTGRLPRRKAVGEIEHKHNHWHDAENGRFTFANNGQFVGQDKWGGGGFTGGGGGSFGGGGASSNEEWPSKEPERAKLLKSLRPLVKLNANTKAKTKQKSTLPNSTGLSSSTGQKDRVILSNGYKYQIDAQDRTKRVSGNMMLSAQQTRSRQAQARAGGADRRPTDDGGHYIAARFNGPTEAFNHFAQDGNFNRGGYRVLEDQWARALKAGKRVTVKISPVYKAASKRPSMINVWFTIDGREESQQFPNERKERNRGKR